jgi:hypothetical protein
VRENWVLATTEIGHPGRERFEGFDGKQGVEA